jgi:hypothetical protein
MAAFPLVIPGRALLARATMCNCTSENPYVLSQFKMPSAMVRKTLGNHPLICPIGCFAILLSSPVSENISLPSRLKSSAYLPPSRPTRGAFRDRHGRWVRDTMDAMARADGRRMLRTAKPSGPDAPTLAFKSLRSKLLRGDGGKKARSPGRARSKP